MIPALLIILPFSFLAGGTVLASQEAAMILFSLFALAAMVRERAIQAWMIYLGAWIFFARVEMVFFGGSRGQVGLGFGSFVTIGFVFYVAAARSKISIETWITSFRVVALLEGVLVLVQFAGYYPVDEALSVFIPVHRELGVEFVTGTMGCPNFVAPFLAMMAPFFFTGNWRWCLPLVVLPVLVSGSSGAVIGLAAGCAVKFRKGTVLAVIALIGTLAVVFDPGGISNSVGARLPWWTNALDHIFSSVKTALFGFGPGIRLNLHTGNNNLHSDWLTCFLNLGFIGTWMAAFSIIKMKKDSVLFPAIIAASVCAMTNQFLYISVSAVFFMTIAGLIEREKWQTI